MSDKNIVVLGKVLDEIFMAQSLLGSRDLDAFLEDEMVKRAVCMTVINVGELVKNLDMEFRSEHPQVPWRDIAGFRDVAAHKYQTLRMDDVYVTVKDEFPAIEEEIASIVEVCSGNANS
ncbi:DUF86 domain-containing protein [uncultured Adlercreutzia sp.]|uniref:HepT-like ribonuclease domain-containing protein n=1 Tax=uncultured Adlercreutzia sp. TaxID=875803 RepID=UPI002675F46F|nr:HepT-like ribonuclease domain-containing protein [uncultured Adlercreutzia sp.]